MNHELQIANSASFNPDSEQIMQNIRRENYINQVRVWLTFEVLFLENKVLLKKKKKKRKYFMISIYSKS